MKKNAEKAERGIIMFCKKCGNEMPDNSEFCAKCGSKIEVAQPEPKATAKKGGSKEYGNSDSIAAIVLGILGIIGLFRLGIIFAVLSLALGIRAKIRSSKVGIGEGLATAGLVCGIIALPVSIIMFLI